ncbi:MAG: VCBS repeat-containing protein [Deltaproteobacteria bacterium]|nr:VCBS repeat-containing protein [Deltaproteobacteria bacterium]
MKVTASDKIPDEVFRVTMGDVDGDGDPEIVAIGRRTIYFYKVKGGAILPFPPVRIARGLEHHFLNVEIFDADGDGKPEIFITDLVNDRLRSFILQYRDGTFATTASDIPHFIVLLSDLEGKKVLAGQSTGLDQIFLGNLHLLNYSKGKVTEGRSIKLPLDDGIFGLNAIPIGKDGKFVYIDVDEHLRLWDGKGKTLSKTKEYFSGARDEVTRGPTTRASTGPANTFIRGRVMPLGGEADNPYLLVRQAEGSTIVRNLRMFKNCRLVIGKYDGGGFSVKTSSETMENLITDAYPLEEKGGRGAIVAATGLEETSSAITTPASRLFLYRVQ